MRELSAFATLETARIVESGSPEPPPLPERMLAPGGFVHRDRRRALGREPRDASPGRETRVLLLDRDGIKPDAALQTAVTEAGAALTVASGKGYSAMLAEPDKSRSPDEVFDTVHSWLEEVPATPERVAPPTPAAEAPTELQFVAFTERPFTASAAPGRLVGISAVPQAERQPFTAVFLNAGAVRRIGPHRLWVDTARRWALRGVPSLRLDLGGIGDSDGDSASLANVAEFYEARYTDQVRAALDQLEQERIGERFVVVGLCSGSSWAFQAALADRRVAAAFMINPRILYWGRGARRCA